MSPVSTTERDYYDLLGVPRTADEQTIKKAFRKLARELHPDVSGEPDAELRFREVSEAYEALSNPETRQLYDRYGHAGLRSGGFQPSHFDLGNFGDLFSAFFGDDLFGAGRRRGGGGSRGADVLAEVTIELVDSAHGVNAEGSARDRDHLRHRAAAAAPLRAPPRSPAGAVAGHGLLQQVSRGILGEFVRQSACPDCNGSGRTVEHLCEDCNGGGRTMQERELDVEIPGRDPGRPADPDHGPGPRRRASAAATATPTSTSTSGRTSDSSARGTTSSPRSTSRSCRPRSGRR